MIYFIEEAIKKHIAEARLPYLRTVESYSGQFDGGLGEVVRFFPAVWVALKQEGIPKAASTTREIWHVPATFLVMVGARALQNEAATRAGGMHIGTYQMLADVRALLLQQDFGLPIRKLRPGVTSNHAGIGQKSKGTSIFAQEWTTVYPLEINMKNRELIYPELVEAPLEYTPPGGEGEPYNPGDTQEENSTEAPVIHTNLNGTTMDKVAPLQRLQRVGVNYYLTMPEDEDIPDAADLLSLSAV